MVDYLKKFLCDIKTYLNRIYWKEIYCFKFCYNVCLNNLKLWEYRRSSKWARLATIKKREAIVYLACCMLQ